MRKMRTAARVMFLALLALGLVQMGTAQPRRSTGAGRRMLIGFKDGVGPQARQRRTRTVQELGGHVHHAFRSMPLVSASIPAQAIANLRKRADIAYIEEDVILHTLADDPEVPWGVDLIDAEKVWRTGNEGAGVHVAILDTGIDYDHPDLAANIVGGIYFAGGFWDEFFGRDGSTSPSAWDDTNGHGTHCAGIVAAVKNGTGVVGIAPQARLHAVRVLDSRGSGYTSDICQGLEWCADPANAIDIVSMSFGGGHTTALQDACQAARNAGVLLTAAAGNEDGGTVLYPAAYDSVIAVSAVDSSDTIASFSSAGKQIELAAPGVNIRSTYVGGSHAVMGGTSMACPHVAGAAALAIAASVANVRSRLQSTAVDLGTPGWDAQYGYGRVNAAAASGVADEPPALTTIEVSPSTATLQVGQTRQFSAIGKDQYGDAIDAGPITWTSDVAAVGAIDASGSFTASAAGSTTISATGAGGVVGYATVTVQDAPVLTAIEVSPSAATLQAGQTQQFTISGKDQYGDPINTGPITWTSDVAAVGAVDASGSFTASVAGSTTISATGAGGVVGYADVTVEEAQATPSMHVGDIGFDSDVRSWGRWGSWCRAVAVVQILDSSGAAVEDARVYGRWSGAYNGTVSGSTNGEGEVTFTTRWVRNGGVFTFEVIDIVKTDWLYDHSANAETDDSITLP